MSKTTMGNKLPRKLEQKMQTVGEQIKLARLRRNLSVVQVAERATCSPLTVSRIEKGTPTGRTGYLFSSDRFEDRKRNSDSSDRHLSPCALCPTAG